mmetsp:Transcript_3427/g.5867  ORF Transcript_3427/g.5867 Transcript_3427/m.5867 type:complete len:257 (+) Transcript_3427:3-773(+)
MMILQGQQDPMQDHQQSMQDHHQQQQQPMQQPQPMQPMQPVHHHQQQQQQPSIQQQSMQPPTQQQSIQPPMDQKQQPKPPQQESHVIDMSIDNESAQQQQFQTKQQQVAEQEQTLRKERVQRYTAKLSAQQVKAPSQSDPNEQSLKAKSQDLIRIYNELEEKVRALMVTSLNSKGAHGPSGPLEEAEGACFTKLSELNAICDQLRRIAQRKLDVLAVEKVLVRRDEQEQQEDPQDVVKGKAEALCVSRSGFQKVVY